MKEIEVCDARYDEGLRSRREKQIVPTLTSHLKNFKSDYSSMILERERESRVENRKEGEQTNIRIRKLTPRECWRLMGFTDEDFNKAEKVVSNNNLYKQAGNSIVVDVLCAIFREML